MNIAEANASMPQDRGGRTGNISGEPEDATRPIELAALDARDRRKKTRRNKPARPFEIN
jgi:hypothetical protein